MTALPLNRLNLWLATINSNKVADADSRARIIRYQEEAADVLFAHFFGRVTSAAPIAAEPEPAPEIDWDEWLRWIGLIDVARRVHGRAGAKQLWAVSPLPQPGPAGITFAAPDTSTEAELAVSRFLDEATERRPGARAHATVLYNAFRHWARVNQEPILAQAIFGRSLRSLGLSKQRSDGFYYLDIALPAFGPGGHRNVGVVRDV